MRGFTKLGGIALVLSVAGGTVACGSEGSPADALDQAGAATPPAGLAPPKFEFLQGPPGRAVGIRAIVDVDGVELTSEPIELALTRAPAADGSSTADAWGAFAMPVQLRTLQQRQSAPPDDAEQTTTDPEDGDPEDTEPDACLYDNVTPPDNACPEAGDRVARMGSINGNVCFLVHSASTGRFGNSNSVTQAYLFGREGVYEFRESVIASYVPPDLANLGFSVSFGCVSADEGSTLSFGYFDDLANLSFSFGLLFTQVGFTLFTHEDRGLVRGLQLDSSVAVSLGLGALSVVPFNFSMSLEQKSCALIPGFRMLRRFEHVSCEDEDAPIDENPIEFARDGLLALEASDEQGLEAELAREMGRGLGPLLESLGNTGQGGLAPNVPAASNADQLDEYLSSSGTELREGAPNTSLDGITESFRDRLVAAGDATEHVLAAANTTAGQMTRSIPSLTGHATLLQQAGSALQAGAELGQLVDPARAAPTSYIAQNVERIVVPSGEPARIEIRAREIADLIDRPIETVNGATLIINAGGRIVDQRFVLSGAGVALELDTERDNLLVRTDVDLSTADGSFPDDVADWVVRPALRLVEIEAGTATRAFVSGPGRLPSGAPASLTVHVLDDNGRVVKRPFGVRFVDAEGNAVGSAESKGGSALFQYIPVPTLPRVLAVTQTTITVAGEVKPGVRVDGTGFSANAVVSVDAIVLTAGTDYQIKGPEEILIVLPGLAAGTHTLTVRNPEDTLTASIDFSFTP